MKVTGDDCLDFENVLLEIRSGLDALHLMSRGLENNGDTPESSAVLYVTLRLQEQIKEALEMLNDAMNDKQD